jgi:hypothetical protein
MVMPPHAQPDAETLSVYLLPLLASIAQFNPLPVAIPVHDYRWSEKITILLPGVKVPRFLSHPRKRERQDRAFGSTFQLEATTGEEGLVLVDYSAAP